MSLTEWRKRSTSAAAAALTSTSSARGEERKALAKAAAWAWHQHSSSGDVGRAVRRPYLGAVQLPSGGVARAHAAPSRYKLEALAAVVRSPTMVEPRPVAPITLLDMYEIERIKRELERLITGSHRREDTAADVVARQGHHRRAPLKNVAAGGGAGGFFGRHAVGICSVRAGVAEAAVVAAHGRRKAATSTSSSTAPATVV